MDFFWDCWLPALYISIWQVVYLTVIIVAAFVIGTIYDAFFSNRRKR